MADNDIIYNDSTPAGAQSFVPESIDVGSVTGSDNVVRKIRRSGMGAKDGAIVSLGAMADPAATADTGTWAVIPLIKRSLARWTTFFSLIPSSLGAKTSSASFSIVPASDAVFNTRPVTAVTWTANTSGTGFLAKDKIIELFSIDDSQSSQSLISLGFYNARTQLLLTATPAPSALTAPEDYIPDAINTATASTGTWQTAIQTLLSQATKTGSLAANNATVVLGLSGPNGTGGIKLSNTWNGTVAAWGTIDGVVYDWPLMMVPATSPASAPVASTTANGDFYVDLAGCIGFEVLMTPYTSGTCTVALSATQGARRMRVASPVNDPTYVALSNGTAALSAASPLPAQLSQGGAVLSAANPVPTQLSQGGAAASASNPVPTQLSQGGAALSSANPVPAQLSQGGAAASASNPVPVQQSIGGAAVSATNPLPGTEAGSAAAAAGITPVTQTATGTASSNVKLIKASQGNLYDAEASNTSGTFGYLVVLDLAAVPANGVAISPIAHRPLYPASGGVPGFAEIDRKPAIACTTGVVIAMTTSLTNYTPSTLTGFMAGAAR